MCQPCNTGWMADLEERSIPILERMMLGGRRTMFPMAQRIVAAWAVKTARMLREATFDHSHDAYSIFPPAHTAHLYTHLEPSPRVRVWLARYSGDDLRLYFRDTTSLRQRKDDVTGVVLHGGAYGQTLLVGNLIFVVVGDWADRPDVGFEVVPSGHGPTMVPLWPPPLARRVIQPDEGGMDTAGFIELTNGLAEAIGS